MINKVKSLYLIKLIEWNNFDKTLIQISLPIILYPFYIWSTIFYLLKKIVYIFFQDLHICSYDF